MGSCSFFSEVVGRVENEAKKKKMSNSLEFF